MSKSTPIVQLQQQQQPPQGQAQEVDEVQEVLQALQSENFQQQQQQQQIDPSPSHFLPSLPQYAPANFYELDTKISDQKDLLTKFLVFDNDVKMAAICAAVFVIVTYVPLERIIFKYISLDKVPYSALFLKALTAAFVFYVFAKLMNV